jgi:hypothetical protein
MTNHRLVSPAVKLAGLAMCAVACTANAMHDYTVTPNVPFIAVPEASAGGLVDFTITNNLAVPLFVVGEGPIRIFEKGDSTDDFAADPFGNVIPFGIPPNGARVQHVFIQVDGGVDDPTDILGGIWSLNLNPDVCFDLLCHQTASGLDNGLVVQITDVPEPPASLMLLSPGAFFFGLICVRKIREPHQLLRL